MMHDMCCFNHLQSLHSLVVIQGAFIEGQLPSTPGQPLPKSAMLHAFTKGQSNPKQQRVLELQGRRKAVAFREPHQSQLLGR